MAKMTTEECRSLDAFRYANLDWCRPALAGESPPVRGSTTWRYPLGAEAASIGWQTRKGVIVLEYRLPLIANQEVKDAVPVELGRGRQAFFRCPGRGCGRRVRYLYLYGGYFRCRHCHDLAYISQQWEWFARERAGERARRRESLLRPQVAETREQIAHRLAQEEAEQERQRRQRYVQRTGRPGRPKEKRHYSHDDSRKVKLGPGEAYCCRCRTARPYRYPRRAELGIQIAIRARCRVCNTPVFRIVRPEEGEGLQDVFDW